ncbi:hypothetical protein C8F04DRAFT_1237950 [Mycena alexandri]|uniref:Uncharacterized protein n=1 Tax=Mycena alexandri TaxID=1745969 RepID=A0AAD6SGW9_9AGAR|nr:hypothetical protein C8F04DRAFT_1237950 [Mycena alexandri]
MHRWGIEPQLRPEWLTKVYTTDGVFQTQPTKKQRAWIGMHQWGIEPQSRREGMTESSTEWRRVPNTTVEVSRPAPSWAAVMKVASSGLNPHHTFEGYKFEVKSKLLAFLRMHRWGIEPQLRPEMTQNADRLVAFSTLHCGPMCLTSFATEPLSKSITSRQDKKTAFDIVSMHQWGIEPQLRQERMTDARQTDGVFQTQLVGFVGLV